MTRTVTIVDYGIGNLNSIGRAITKAGGRADITSDQDRVAQADLLLLPGVGAFGPCAQKLRDSGLAEPALAFARTGRPFLGICVGMQLLFDYSIEFGRHEGLGILAGHVAPIPTVRADGLSRKVPHIGWSPIQLPESRQTWEGTLLESATPGVTATYFVHSFSCEPDNSRDRLAEAMYQGFRVCAAVQHENITGFQSHPEKSGPAGLRILESFLNS